MIHSISDFTESCIAIVRSRFCNDQWRHMAPKDLDKEIDVVAKLILQINFLLFLESCTEERER